MVSDAQKLFIDLLFDVSLRALWHDDPDVVLNSRGLSDAEKEMFRKLDSRGLALDAQGRSQYLMSALCRSFPYTVACLGTVKETAFHLELFLKHIPSFQHTEERTMAFGRYLSDWVMDNPWNGTPALVEMVRTVHSFEMAIAENTARCRAAVNAGEAPPRIEKYTSGMLKKRPLVLPSYFLVFEMPVSFGVLNQALFSPKAEDVWQRVQAGQNLDLVRLKAVAQGTTMPVTALARAQVLGIQGQRGGAGGVAPMIHITHKKLELSGRKSTVFSKIDGVKTLRSYPADATKFLKQLLDLGFLALK